jgi:plastocyanin
MALALRRGIQFNMLKPGFYGRTRSILNPVTIVLSALVLAGESRAASTNVNFANYYFSPTSVTVKAGDTVNWTWTPKSGGYGGYGGGGETESYHTITGTGSEPFCGNDYGVTACSVTFLSPGSYRYVCLTHSNLNMTGLVVVVSSVATPAMLTNAYFGANGAFQFNVNGVSSATSVIESSTNLSSPTNWVAIATNSTGSNSILFSDTPNGSPFRFYRVLQH